MKISQESIYRILESAAERGLTVKEMLTTMNQSKKRKTIVRKALKALTNKKVCYKKNNRYYLQDVSPKHPRQIQKSSTAVAARRSHQTRKNEFLGLVTTTKSGFKLFSLDHQTTFPVRKGSIRDFLHGDLVRFSLYQEKSGNQSASLHDLAERKINRIKGCIHRGKMGQLYFMPDSSHFSTEFIVTNKINLEEDNIPAWLEIAQTRKNKNLPEGKALPIKREDPYENPVLDQILVSNKIPQKFPNSVLKQCESLPSSVRIQKNSNRKDLRDLNFVTIDGEDAKDFDDAVYAESRGDGYKIWVSIADVDEYVPHGSVLDREAFSRGTSTYIPGRVYPMLPEPLSNGLCSLKEGVNRFTLTCEMEMDSKGRVFSTKLYTSINKIACRLTYTTVDEYFKTGKIRKRKSFPNLTDHLDLYRKIAVILKEKRVKEGFINFHLPEASFEYDADNKIKGIKKGYQTEAMQVIEQLMLLANENVAKYCDRKKIPIVWRNHPQPLPEKRRQLHNLFWNCAVNVSSINSSRDYNIALEAAKSSSDKDFLEYSMLRSMSLAVYEVERKGHFGISATHYCHFTSPIRRFPDLLVHRAVKRHLRGEKPLQIPEYIAAANSDRERLATNAERSSAKLFKLDFISDRIGSIFNVKVIGFIHSGLFVELDDPYVEGFVSFKSILDDHYEFDEDNMCVWGRSSREKFSIGHRMKVILTRLDTGNLSPDFDWICWL